MWKENPMEDTDNTFHSGKCLCLECGHRCFRIKDLRSHLSTQNGVIFRTESIIMQSLKGKNWALKWGETRRSIWAKSILRKMTNVFSLIGTCKIERNVTWTLVTTRESDGKNTVEVCHTDYGHEREIQHVWLPKGKQQKLAAKIQ